MKMKSIEKGFESSLMEINYNIYTAQGSFLYAFLVSPDGSAHLDTF